MKKFLSIFLIGICFSTFAETVVVVGAGLAGLTAAYRLQEAGFLVEVYEARVRPGGRVCTAYFGDSYEELGGKNLLDGGEAVAIKGLIGELGLEIESQALQVGDGVFYFQNKSYLIKDLMATGPEPTEGFYERLKGHAKSAKNLAELVLPLFHDNYPLESLIHFCLTNFIGSPPEKLAPDVDLFWYIYTYFYHSPGQDGKVYRFEGVEGGNSCLIKALTDVLGRKIHYNQPLKRIAFQGPHFELHFPEGVVSADRVVLAIPASTLRDVTFDGDWLPSDQIEAIQTQSYGTNAKILQPVSNYALDPPLFVCTNRVCTWMNISRDVMTWYYGGQAGIFTEANLSKICCLDLEPMQKVYPELRFSDQPPNYMKDLFMACYEGPVGISWDEEEFSKGSYSNLGAGQAAFFNESIEWHGEKIRKVYRPFREALYFAGEHTDLSNPSTMEGAVHSGEVAAKMIIQHPSR